MFFDLEPNLIVNRVSFRITFYVSVFDQYF